MKKQLEFVLPFALVAGFGFTAVSANADTMSPFYRLSHPQTNLYNWTSNSSEHQSDVSHNWIDNGVVFELDTTAPATKSGIPAVYRLVNSNGDNYFTASASHATAVAKTKGWTSKGIVGYSEGSIPVYEFYNSRLGYHFYTTSLSEANSLEEKGYSSENGKSTTPMVSFYAEMTTPAPTSPSVIYQAQVQNWGWEDATQNGELAGSVGQGLRMESLYTRLSLPVGLSGGIQERAYVQNIGWQPWVQNSSNYIGTVGKGLRIEAVEMNLTGALAQNYSVQYQVQGQNYGWQSWRADDELAGTTGQALRVEGIKIKIVPKINYNQVQTGNIFDKYSDVSGDVTYGNLVYLDANRNFNWGYQNNNTYAAYNNTVYNLNQEMLQTAENVDHSDWQARQNWSNQENQIQQAINQDQTTLNSANAQVTQYQTLYNQEVTYVAEEQVNGLPTTQDATLEQQYQTDLTNATDSVTDAKTQLANDTASLTNLKATGTDYVKLFESVTKDNTGRTITIHYTQTNYTAGQSTTKSWSDNPVYLSY